MSAISKLLQICFFGCFIYAIWWFVNFNMDPNSLCKTHPDKSKRKNYLICRPFNIEVEKPNIGDTNLWKDKYGKPLEGGKKRD